MMVRTMPTALSLLVLVIPVIGMLGFLVTLARSRHQERLDRLRLMETALREGRLEGAERDVLLAELTSGAVPRSPRERRRRALSRLALAAGWITVFVAGGLLATGSRHNIEPGIFLLVFGFGIVTLPSVMREYDERMG